MALNQSGGRGELRSAMEGLLRSCAELDHYSTEAGHGARNEAHAIAEELARLKLPGMSGLADEIAAIGTQMDTGVTTNLADARRPYLEEAHQLLGLLAPFHGVTEALPPLTSVTGTSPGADAIAGHFPPGFAQNYVADILGSVQNSTTLNAGDADRVATIPTDDAANSTNSTKDGYSRPQLREGVARTSPANTHGRSSPTAP